MTLRTARTALAGTVLAFAGIASATGPDGTPGGWAPTHPAHNTTAPYVASGATATPSQDIRVEIDHTKLLQLPLPASAVVVGNPDIADVAVHRADALLVLGRGYGTTNLLVMDTAGRIMADYTLTVGVREAGSVRIHDGDKRKTYSCNPRCLPAPQLGDDQEFVGMYDVDAPQIQNLTAGSAVPAPSGMDQGFVAGGDASGGFPMDPS